MRHSDCSGSVRWARICGWMFLLAAVACAMGVQANAVFASDSTRDMDSSLPARVRQFSPRAVGGSWATGVADRLDALATHTLLVAALRVRRRGAEPVYSRIAAPKPGWLLDASRAERRR